MPCAGDGRRQKRHQILGLLSRAKGESLGFPPALRAGDTSGCSDPLLRGNIVGGGITGSSACTFC